MNFESQWKNIGIAEGYHVIAQKSAESSFSKLTSYFFHHFDIRSRLSLHAIWGRSNVIRETGTNFRYAIVANHSYDSPKILQNRWWTSQRNFIPERFNFFNWKVLQSYHSAKWLGMENGLVKFKGPRTDNRWASNIENSPFMADLSLVFHWNWIYSSNTRSMLAR